MSKLEYRTKAPKKGYVFNESFMTHKTVNIYDNIPPMEIQEKAHRLVSKTLEKLIEEMTQLGYDPTRAGFFIHFKK